MEDKIFSLERPDRSLLKLYVIRSVLSGPFIIFVLPFFLFRYMTLRYRFDDQGIHMRHGVLFRKEVNLTYARIQDIHLSSGVIQRWLKLADIQVQTASGTAGPEMTIEGFPCFDEIRNFLYGRMRGIDGKSKQLKAVSPNSVGPDAEMVELLNAIREELKGTRVAVESVSKGGRS